jgi:alkylated DNA repair dioxygenase AlkB
MYVINAAGCLLHSTHVHFCSSDWPELLDLGGEEGKKMLSLLAFKPCMFIRSTVPSSTDAVSVQAPPGSCFAWKPDGCVRVCSFDCAPGLYVMPNSLSVLQQQELAIHAYTTLAHPQYDCSLQSTVCLPTEHTLLHHWRDSLRTGCPASSDCSTAATSSGDPAGSNGSVRSRLKPLPQDAAGIEQVLRRLRWTVLGYRYDWSSLSYDWGQEPQPLPTCITRVANDAVELLQQHPVALQCGIFKPQAAVVNFYQVGDSLTSHVDRSEPAAGAPLVTEPCMQTHVFLYL